MGEGVFIGCPTQSGMIDCNCAERLYLDPSRSWECIVKIQGGLLTTTACTRLWADALNVRDTTQREDGYRFRWFAMLHSDVDPGSWWVDRLINLAEEYEADLVSAVVPLKGDRGLTSTAIAHPENPGLFCSRLTLRQLHHESFPRTFDGELAAKSLAELPDDMHVASPSGCHLLANTGCMVCRLDRPWSGEVWFDVVDRLFHAEGMWRTASFPDDWGFTRRVAMAGGRVMATTEVETIHKGGGLFPSSVADHGLHRDDGIYN